MNKPKKENIALLALDHPGANDPTYRARRAMIADEADRFLKDPRHIPIIPYSDEEQGTWSAVLEKLHGMHVRFASSSYREGKERLDLPQREVPQLGELSEKTFSLNRVKVEPVGGLVDVRWFLGKLGARTMVSTQYIRHHSRPEYTPEPDIIHEVVGHVPMLLDPELASFSERLGQAALRADEHQLKKIETLYWFTIEFGLIKEKDGVRAFGAGLLSSFGELPHAFSGAATWKPFSVEEILRTPYVYTEMQKTLFVIPSLKTLLAETEAFLEREEL